MPQNPGASTVRVAFACLLLAAACSRTGADDSGPTAALEVAFDDSPAVHVAGVVTASSSPTRAMIQTADVDITVLVSMAAPLEVTSMEIADTNTNIIVWAKKGGGSPLIASQGSVDVHADGSTWNLSLVGLQREADASGGRVTISGSITGVAFP